MHQSCGRGGGVEEEYIANDWCVEADGSFVQSRLDAMLSAYNAIRPITGAESTAWPAVLRAAALRFWLSRLQDKHFPRAGELVHTKNPDEFKDILSDRIQHSERYLNYWPIST